MRVLLDQNVGDVFGGADFTLSADFATVDSTAVLGGGDVVVSPKYLYGFGLEKAMSITGMILPPIQRVVVDPIIRL